MILNARNKLVMAISSIHSSILAYFSTSKYKLKLKRHGEISQIKIFLRVFSLCIEFDYYQYLEKGVTAHQDLNC